MPFSSRGTRLFERAQWISDFNPGRSQRSNNDFTKKVNQSFSQPSIRIYAPGAISQVPYSFDPKVFQPKNAIR